MEDSLHLLHGTKEVPEGSNIGEGASILWHTNIIKSAPARRDPSRSRSRKELTPRITGKMYKKRREANTKKGKDKKLKARKEKIKK